MQNKAWQAYFWFPALLPPAVDLNRPHLKDLRNLMWDKVGDFSNEFDEYASTLFERPIRGSWRILINMTAQGVPHSGPGNPWHWDALSQAPSYPAEEVLTFELFASIFLHEVAHGWFYLLTDCEALQKWAEASDYKFSRKDETNWRRDEEDICWEISRLVCRILEIEFDEEAIPERPAVE